MCSTHIHLKNLQESIWVRLKRFVLDIIHPMFFALFYNFHWTCFTSKNLVTSWNCTWVQVWRGYLQAMTPNAFFWENFSLYAHWIPKVRSSKLLCLLRRPFTRLTNKIKSFHCMTCGLDFLWEFVRPLQRLQNYVFQCHISFLKICFRTSFSSFRTSFSTLFHFVSRDVTGQAVESCTVLSPAPHPGPWQDCELVQLSHCPRTMKELLSLSHSQLEHYFCPNLYGRAPRGPMGVKKSHFFFHKWNCFPFALRLPSKCRNCKKLSKLKKNHQKTLFS